MTAQQNELKTVYAHEQDYTRTLACTHTHSHTHEVTRTNAFASIADLPLVQENTHPKPRRTRKHADTLIPTSLMASPHHLWCQDKIRISPLSHHENRVADGRPIKPGAEEAMFDAPIPHGSTPPRIPPPTPTEALMSLDPPAVLAPTLFEEEEESSDE